MITAGGFGFGSTYHKQYGFTTTVAPAERQHSCMVRVDHHGHGRRVDCSSSPCLRHEHLAHLPHARVLVSRHSARAVEQPRRRRHIHHARAQRRLEEVAQLLHLILCQRRALLAFRRQVVGQHSVVDELDGFAADIGHARVQKLVEGSEGVAAGAA